MSDFLSSMVSDSRLRAEATRTAAGEDRLRSMVASTPPARRLELGAAGFDLIAEAKLASPSEGTLAPESDLLRLSGAMAAAGAAALSVLTEPTVFNGALNHLTQVAEVAPVPVMRKDFLVDPIQVLEARAAGASGVLLIARCLDQAQIEEMTDLAVELGMFVLMEVFDEADIDHAQVVFDRPILLGVNARNLVTLEVEGDKHRRLRSSLPDDLPAVAESGINSAADAEACAALGYRMALVGTALVANGDPSTLATEILAAGRLAASGVGG